MNLITSPFQLREVDILQVTDNLSEPELICDVICMMYDASDPNSFRYISSIFLVRSLILTMKRSQFKAYLSYLTETFQRGQNTCSSRFSQE